jgi:hypothetical protein
VAVDRDVPDAVIVKLSGTFMTKVFEGPYRDVGKWIAEMGRLSAERGRRLAKIDFCYATCPRCAKHFGRNEVVLFAQAAPAAGSI